MVYSLLRVRFVGGKDGVSLELLLGAVAEALSRFPIPRCFSQKLHRPVASLTKALATLITYPYILAKARLQADRDRTIFACIRIAWRKGVFVGIYQVLSGKWYLILSINCTFNTSRPWFVCQGLLAVIYQHVGSVAVGLSF